MSDEVVSVSFEEVVSVSDDVVISDEISLSVDAVEAVSMVDDGVTVEGIDVLSASFLQAQIDSASVKTDAIIRTFFMCGLLLLFVVRERVYYNKIIKIGRNREANKVN